MEAVTESISIKLPNRGKAETAQSQALQQGPQRMGKHVNLHFGLAFDCVKYCPATCRARSKVSSTCADSLSHMETVSSRAASGITDLPR